MASFERRSLLRRLFVRIAPVTLVVLIVASVLMHAIARHYSDEVYDRWLYDSARTLASQLRFRQEQPPFDIPAIAFEMFTWDEADHIYFEVQSDTRGRLAGNTHFARPTSTAARTMDARGRYVDTVVAGEPVRAVEIAVHSPLSDEVVRVTVGETLNKRTKLAGEILLGTIPLQLVLLVAGVLATGVALFQGVRIVSDTAAAIRRRSPTDLAPVTVPQPVPAELAPLIDAINLLLARVAEAQRGQKRFLGNAAHQLRTPVATLQIQIERALREREPEGRAAALRQVDLAIRRLGHLLHQVLRISQLEPDGGPVPAPVRCDLVDVARDSIEAALDQAVEVGCDLGYEGPAAGVDVLAMPAMLGEMVANLIDNAIKYGGPGVHVTVGVADDPPRLYVEDDGPGIAEDERERVWERFHRAPNAPGYGCGLGLAIVREIADRHAAKASIDARPDGRGTRVTITFRAPYRPQPAVPAGTGRQSAPRTIAP